MRILVFSDSHGRTRPMLDALERYDVDGVFHLGDVVRDGELLRQHTQLPFYQVAGNCDLLHPGYPEEQVARLGGKTIFYLHGHTRGVKSGVDRAVYQAQAVEADVVLFGHTHRPLCQRFGGVLAVNPGAAADGRGALLSWTEGEITVEPLTL